MPENYRHFRNRKSSNTGLTKTQIKDDSDSKSRSSLNSLNNFSINYAKCSKQCTPEKRAHLGTLTTRPVYNSSTNDNSHMKNQRKRLRAGRTDDFPKKSKKIDTTKNGNVNVNVVVLELSGYHEKPDILCREYAEHSELRKPKPCRTCATQTLYRESSAQTLPYLPEVSNALEEVEDAEIFKLPTILPGDGPPGLYEVEVLERARKRWAFLKSIKENMRHTQKVAREHVEYIKHKHILTAFEWEHWIEREEYIQECQLLRLEILIRMFNERERKFQATSNERIQMSCSRIEMERQASLKKNATNFARSLRILNSTREKHSRVWHKESIINELAYPGSEFYAPKMRYGVNPNRRHGKISRKGFDMRMDDLEKQAINMDPKKLKCPFSKLRAWSKPRQPLQEFEQNFCSEDNLKALYESLRNLRLGATRERVIPQCLKVKKVVRPSKSVTAGGEGEEAKPVVLYEYASADTEAEVDLDVDNEQISEPSMLTSSETQTSESTITPIFELSLEDLYETAQQRNYSEELKQEKLIEKLQNELYKKETRREEIENLMSTFEGRTIGWLMRFLSEEMVRVKEQRKLHFYCMLAQRERWHREAVEAGLRQKENCMRDTYEKLYEECDSINVEITEKYLQDILNTDIADYAHQDAENHVAELAKTVDKDIEAWLESFNEVQTPLNSASLRCSLKAIVMADKNEILCRLIKTETIKYIINDVLLGNVFKQLEPYDISTAIIDDLIDRLIDNDLYIFSTECSSIESDYIPEYSAEAQHEAKAIIRKLIKQSVPGRRWRNSTECLVHGNINELLDEIFNIEAAKDFIYEDKTQSQHIQSQPSFIDILHPNLHQRPIYSEVSSISTSDRELNVLSLNDYEQIWDLETTRALRDSEHLLIIDPDVLSMDTHEINYTAYRRLRPPDIEISLIHNVPSTHALQENQEFSKTPIYAPSSDEDEEENNKRSQSIVSGACDRILSIASECEEQGETISDVEMFETGSEIETTIVEGPPTTLVEAPGDISQTSSCEGDSSKEHTEKHTRVNKEMSQVTQALPAESKTKVKEEFEMAVGETTNQKHTSVKDEENPNQCQGNEDAQIVMEESKCPIAEEPKVNVKEENEVIKEQQPEITISAEGTTAVENKEEESKINEEELKQITNKV